MILHAMQTGSPFVKEIFRIGYCIRGNCTSEQTNTSYTNEVPSAKQV